MKSGKLTSPVDPSSQREENGPQSAEQLRLLEAFRAKLHAASASQQGLASRAFRKLRIDHSLRVVRDFLAMFDACLEVEARTFWGGKMSCILPESVSLSVFRSGFFEEGLTTMVVRHLEKGMTFFDVGAHLGYFSLLGSEIVGPTGQVHAFEPSPRTYRLLMRNIGGRTNITANNLALFSRADTLWLNENSPLFSGFDSLYAPRLKKSTRKWMKQKKRQVSAIPLDQYVDQTGAAPDFVKIDAESAEFEILKGMESTVRRKKPIITLEVGDLGVADAPPSSVVVAYLAERGYEPFEYKDGHIVRHSLRDSYAYDNILFLPR